MSEIQLRAEMRLNNAIFFCRLDEKFHNVKDTKVYAIAELKGLVPIPNGVDMKMESFLICEKCWEEKGEELHLEEPSKIVIPKGKLPDMPPNGRN